jgi:predicted AAA+ superfamily ATPase
VDYLKKAYIIDELPQYSNKAKKELSFYGKIYNADVALNSIRVSNGRYDLDHNLENIVYNELIYMGYELFVFSNNGKEIDFMATKDGKTYFVQVAYSVTDSKAYDREFNAFKGLDNLNEKILITTDPIDYSTSAIRHIKFNDFLLMNDLKQ